MRIGPKSKQNQAKYRPKVTKLSCGASEACILHYTSLVSLYTMYNVNFDMVGCFDPSLGGNSE